MKKSKFWIVLSLILLFASGVVAGIFADKWFLGKDAGARHGQSGHPPSRDRWMKDLGLSAEQQAKIREIFQRNEERMKSLRTDFYQHLDEIRGRLKTEIDAVLTVEQKHKLEAMIQKQEQERRNSSDRRQGPRESRSGDPHNN